MADRESDLVQMSDERFLKQSKKQHGVEGGGGETSKSDQSVCYRMGTDPLGLVSWMQSLRMWISQTVLVRCVYEVSGEMNK